MRFGNQMDLKIKLPSKDTRLATQFISNTEELIKCLWLEDKYRKIEKDKYLLIMNPITIPGFSSITPEIEVEFS